MDNTSIGDEKKSGHGHVASPLFTKLPAELRLKIYREAFSGSRAISRPLNPPHTMAIILEHFLHDQLLFTCRQVYEEARPIYWSMTTVNVGLAVCIHRGDLEKVIGTIPSYARPFIRELQGIWVDPGTRMGFHEFLDHFKQLEIVILRDHDGPGYYADHGDPAKCECDYGGCDCESSERLPYLMDKGLESAGLSSDELATSAEPLKVAVLQKVTYFVHIIAWRWGVFINRTTGKTYKALGEDTQELEDYDDSGFQQVL